MRRAILIDMDGVLFDSMPNHARAWVSAARDFDLPLSYQEVFIHEGRTGKSTIDILMQRKCGRDSTDQEVADIYARKCHYFNLLPPAEPMPGALDFLQQARADGYLIVLVTGSGQHSLLDHLNLFFPSIFSPELMVTSFDVSEGKPSPEPYLMGLRKAGVGADQAIAIENAPLGVRSAVAAQVRTIAVNTGPLPDSALLAEHPWLLLPSMQTLAEQWAAIRG